MILDAVGTTGRQLSSIPRVGKIVSSLRTRISGLAEGNVLPRTAIKQGLYLIVAAMVVSTLSGARAGRASRRAAVGATPWTRVAPRGPSA